MIEISELQREMQERVRAEEELRRTTQLLQAVIDGTQDVIYVKDRDGKHLMFNSAASRMVGKPADEVLGRDDTAIFDPEDAAPGDGARPARHGVGDFRNR